MVGDIVTPGKVCTVCKTFKPYAEYYSHKQMADGYLEKCKECHKERIRSNRKAKSDYYQAYDRKRANNPDRVLARAEYAKAHPKSREVQLRWMEKNKEKRKAHVLVGNAIRNKTLIKQPCEVCQTTIVDAHHDDYSKPLDVRWLCRTHHMELHKKIRNLPMDIPKPKSNRWSAKK